MEVCMIEGNLHSVDVIFVPAGEIVKDRNVKPAHKTDEKEMGDSGTLPGLFSEHYRSLWSSR